MVDREVIIARLKHLEDYIRYLKKKRNCGYNEFIRNPDNYLSCERALHLSIEAILDIGNHIIADHRYRSPEDNKDIFIILNENGIIPDSLKKQLVGMAKFRNILVHDYLELDREIVYDILQNNIEDIEKFVHIIKEYI